MIDTLFLPGGQHRRAAPDHQRQQNNDGNQQPDQDIRPQNDNLKIAHEKRILGSTRV
jgi:hypothetical protein